VALLKQNGKSGLEDVRDDEQQPGREDSMAGKPVP
jgi:hypothetical protein